MEHDAIGSRTLDGFCAEVRTRYAATWPPPETVLVQEFFAYFGGAGHMGSFENLARFCSGIGIDVSTAALPDEMRGCNYWHAGRRAIAVAHGPAFIISGEHTVFHELRELLEYVFQEVGHPTIPVTALEAQAEAFAVHARMTVVVETSTYLLDRAQSLRSPWRRLCAFGLVGLGAVAALVGCALVSQLEDRLDTQRSTVPT